MGCVLMPMEQVRQHPLERHAQLVDVQTVRVGDMMHVDGRFEPVTHTRYSSVTLKCLVGVSYSRTLARDPGTKVLVIRRWHRPDWTGD